MQSNKQVSLRADLKPDRELEFWTVIGIVEFV